MYAIIATGGKQYKVEEGDVIKVEKLGVDAGETVTFDQVLAVNNGELQIGCPTVAGATVTATVEKEGKGKKVIVYIFIIIRDIGTNMKFCNLFHSNILAKLIFYYYFYPKVIQFNVAITLHSCSYR